MSTNRLAEIRKKKRYTQLKVAMELSISREALSYYETGKRGIDSQMLCRLADYYGVSIDYILCRTNNPKINI